MAWPCTTSCDVIAPWPDMTRSIFFYQKLRKGCPISYAKFQHDPSDSSGYIAKKTQGGRIDPPARAMVKMTATAPTNRIILLSESHVCIVEPRSDSNPSSLSTESPTLFQLNCGTDGLASLAFSWHELQHRLLMSWRRLKVKGTRICFAEPLVRQSVQYPSTMKV